MATLIRQTVRAAFAFLLVSAVMTLAPALFPTESRLPAPGSLLSVARAQGVDEKQAQEIAKLLKCPVCQNLSVADSPSPLAEQMRGIIKERLAAGQSRDEIIAYFVDRYGEEVLLDPPKRGFSQIIWWGAAAGFAVGALAVGWFIYGRLRRTGAPAEDAFVSDVDLRTYEDLLEKEIATGTPDVAMEPPAPTGASPPTYRPDLGRQA